MRKTSYKIKVVCIHKERKPHRIHYAWESSVADEFYRIIPDAFYGELHTNVNNTVLLQILAFFKSFKLPKADVYIVDGMISMLPAILHKKKGTKIILVNSDTFFYNYKRANLITKTIYRFYLKYVDAIISTSNMLREMGKEYTKVPHKVVYPFVEEKFLKNRANITSKDICYFGRLTPEKNIDLIVDIFSDVESKNKRKLILIGGNYAPKKKDKNIIVKSWSKDVISEVKNCGLFIMLSRYDSFGVSILEAMGLGIPTIISEYCGAKEVVSKVSKKLVVDLNKEKIINLINKINSNEKLKRELSIKSRKIAEKMTREQSVNSFKKAFYELVKK